MNLPLPEPPYAVTAKLIEWEQQGPNEWAESRYGFYVSFDPDEEDRFCAAWGEGDPEHFATEAEAKAWCQREIDAWIAECAVVTYAADLAAKLEAAQRDAVSEAAAWAELTTDQLQLLPRKLLDLAGRVRTRETAAHALNGFLRQYAGRDLAVAAIDAALKEKL